MKNGQKKLEKLEIIGNNPIRKDNKEVYKLEIINQNITIKTQDLAYSLENRKEFKIRMERYMNFDPIKLR